ncbi:type VI secretion system baseplate subunit TssG [Marinimicrobium sp. ARAG 43.8]|uniref:type VI secretion system baseplate subunit TssG n=1 Tax=Marinimicrobium sp. ARAG 43.8 TaxID=3418719 RepID=UPI003CF3DC34
MPVIHHLQKKPESFTWLQTLRLLEFRHSETDLPSSIRSPGRQWAPGADFRPPQQEAVRLKGQHTLAFPHSEISHLKTGNQRWEVQSGMFGLTGALGPLPFHYTEQLIDRQKSRDPALQQFLDLFHHRSNSLLWRAANKYRLPLEYERARRHWGDAHTMDRPTEWLLSLIGLSPRLVKDAGSVPNEALLYYGGLISQQVKTAANLKQLIRSYFKVPTQVEEFSGTWCDVLPAMLCQLPSITQPDGRNNQLGVSTLLGQKSWLAQNKVSLHIGPLNREQYQRFSPGTSTLQALDELNRLYLGPEHQFDIKLHVDTDAMPKQLCLGSTQPAQLGWNSRLPASIYRPADANTTLMVPVSTIRQDERSPSSHNHGPSRPAA